MKNNAARAKAIDRLLAHADTLVAIAERDLALAAVIHAQRECRRRVALKDKLRHEVEVAFKNRKADGLKNLKDKSARMGWCSSRAMNAAMAVVRY
jgi:C4-dicarboxylate-specific signal transduction histidine kinase